MRWAEQAFLAHMSTCSLWAVFVFFVLQEPDLNWDGFTMSMRPSPWTLLHANTPSVLRAACLHNFSEWSLRKGRWVYYVTKQTIITVNNLSAYHGRLVKGLRASAHRNPCKRIFLGMREGVGGTQQGQGRCGERYDPFLHLSRGHGKPFQIIGLITCRADPMTAM